MENDTLGSEVNLADGYFVIIDKPPNHTSSEVTSFVKSMLGLKRAGHAGTLDPNVTGVLPIALGRATKLVDYISKSTKIYVGIAGFKGKIDEHTVRSVFSEFEGDIIQTPPKMSAVRKAPRRRHIYYLNILEIKYKRVSKTHMDGGITPNSDYSSDHITLVLFRTKVDAGTYIRTLCVDIGKRWNGGRMLELRRTHVGDISEDKAHTLQELSEAVWFMKHKREHNHIQKLLIKPEDIIDLPTITIKKTALKFVCSGAPISRPGLINFDNVPSVRRNDFVKVFCCGKFIGIGKALLDKERMISKRKAVCFKMERVHWEIRSQE